MEQYAWPQKGARVFEEGGDRHEFAHFGWGGVDSQFAGYTEGYREAANALVEAALTSRDIKTLDTFVYPILFLYRQYLELDLKWTILLHSGKSRQQKQAMLRKSGHNLSTLWQELKPLLLEATSDRDRTDIEVAEDYIMQFHRLDENSFTFRYPVTKDLEQVINQQRRLNLRVLRRRMDELNGFLNGADGKLSELTDYRSEMATFLSSEL